jgi:fucose permease
LSRDQRGEGFSLLYAGFFLLGVVTVQIGPLIPTLGLTWDLPHGELAWLFPAQFLATAVGSIFSTRNLRRSLAIGYALLAGGLAIVPFGGWPLAAFAFALVGLGIGLVAPATNLLVAGARPPEERTAALATANLVWGLGAAGSPLFLGFSLETLGLAGFLGLLAALFLLTGIALVARRPPPTPDAEEAPPSPGEPTPRTPFLLLAAIFFCYLGVETSIGGWLVALSEQVGTKGFLPLLIASGFWTTFLLSRAVVAAGLVRHFAETSLYLVGLTLTGLGLLLLLLSPSLPGIASGGLLTGLALGPLFPFTVTFLAEVMNRRGARDTGWIFAIGGCGAAAFPWLTGRLGDAMGLQVAFVVPLVGLVVLAGLFLVFRPFLASLASTDSVASQD